MGAIGLVIVSHSALIAQGVVQLARQMAPTVRLIPAGGSDDGGIGTCFELISAAIAEADAGDGAVILCDLGSAVLTSETALDFLDDEQKERIRIADAPIVEGSVAAAVAAEAGDDLATVLAAAESAGGATPAADLGDGEVSADTAVSDEASHERTVTLVNPSGLHARPAAELVKLAATFDVALTVNGTNARSLLAIMALGLRQGAAVTIAADGSEEGARAVDALADLAESGFGE